MNLVVQRKHDTAIGGLIFLALALVILGILAVQRIKFPDIHAGEAAKAVLSWISAILVIGGAGVVVVVGAIHLRVSIILLGILTILIGLTLVGISVGLPPALQPIFGLLQAIVDLLNLVIGIIGKLAGVE